MQRKIGLIGGGNMAAAILEGLLKNSGHKSEQIRCSEPNPERRAWLTAHYGIETCDDNRAIVEFADCVVIAVKPQVLDEALGPCKPSWRSGQLAISICAGVTLAQLHVQCGGVPALVRAMPNTPALVGAGATAIAAEPQTSVADRAFARELFESTGICLELEERYLDAVTGLSGSGPAYVMLFIEALADGGVRAGLPRSVASALATQTVIGSAKLLQHGHAGAHHPAQLKDQVASPGGTTIEGIFALESAGFRGAVMDAVCRATARAKELGKG